MTNIIRISKSRKITAIRARYVACRDKIPYKVWAGQPKETTHLENLKSRNKIGGFGLDAGGPGQGQASIMKVRRFVVRVT
jgi:hypothetical protein